MEVVNQILFAGNYILTAITNLLLKYNVPLSESQIGKIGVAALLIIIYLVVEFAQALKPIIKITIVILLLWILVGFFV